MSIGHLHREIVGARNSKKHIIVIAPSDSAASFYARKILKEELKAEVIELTPDMLEQYSPDDLSAVAQALIPKFKNNKTSLFLNLDQYSGRLRNVLEYDLLKSRIHERNPMTGSIVGDGKRFSPSVIFCRSFIGLPEDLVRKSKVLRYVPSDEEEASVTSEVNE